MLENPLIPLLAVCICGLTVKMSFTLIPVSLVNSILERIKTILFQHRSDRITGISIGCWHLFLLKQDPLFNLKGFEEVISVCASKDTSDQNMTSGDCSPWAKSLSFICESSFKMVSIVATVWEPVVPNPAKPIAKILWKHALISDDKEQVLPNWRHLPLNQLLIWSHR